MICVVGEYMSRDTPDPIPNSEVKSWQPMILLSGKVGYCQLFQPRNRKVAGLSFYIMSLVRKDEAFSYGKAQFMYAKQGVFCKFYA